MRDVIVMAAGEGRRLRPLTDRWPKPVLPVDGRPVIATLLRELAAAGCTRAFVVTGHLAAQVEALVGDGAGFGLDVRYVRQPPAAGASGSRVLGSADTVRRSLAAGAEPPLLVTAADTVYTAGDVGRFAAAFAASGAAGAMSARREPPPEPPHRYAVRIVDGLVVEPFDEDPANPLAGAPLWGFGPPLVPFLDDLPGPPFQLGAALAAAIGAGVPIAGIEIGRTRDVTRPEDVVAENFPYLAGL